MRKLVLSFVALALMVSPALAGKYNDVLSVGDQAPNFSGIPATYQGQDTSISLGDIEEDVVVLVFLANHCPFVKAAEDRINDFVQDYKDKSVKVVGVSVNDLDADRLPKIKEWVDEHNSQYVYGYDASQKLGRKYGATATPEFFVLDENRTIRYMGAFDDAPMNEAKASKQYLRNAVDAVLAGETPEIQETRAIGCSIKYTK